jgi:hypothetical protein
MMSEALLIAATFCSAFGNRVEEAKCVHKVMACYHHQKDPKAQKTILLDKAGSVPAVPAPSGDADESLLEKCLEKN